MPLSPLLLDRVLVKLGVERRPSADLAGLRELYQAWCLHVPFDNIRKMIALRTEREAPLPGGTADDFFEAWLTYGSGGTCWPGSNGLFEVLCGLGFNAVRAVGSMRDLGIPNHASVRVTIDGAQWLVDSSLLTNVPLPLASEVYIGRDPVYPVEVELDNGTHLLWLDVPPGSTPLCCRLLEYDVPHELYLRRYEESRARSAFNDLVYARRNRADELLIVRGPGLWRKTAVGVENCELSRTSLCECLRDEIGIAGSLIDKWVASGSLEASFQPYSGPPPAPVEVRKPPSQR